MVAAVRTAEAMSCVRGVCVWGGGALSVPSLESPVQWPHLCTRPHSFPCRPLESEAAQLRTKVASLEAAAKSREQEATRLSRLLERQRGDGEVAEAKVVATAAEAVGKLEARLSQAQVRRGGRG